MINIIGIALSFVGTLLTLFNVIFGKPGKKGTTWGELEGISPAQYKNKWFSIYGLSIMALGFILQFYAAFIVL